MSRAQSLDLLTKVCMWWKPLLTRLRVRADEQVIRPGCEVLQRPNRLRKVFDEWDALHMYQWWTGELHVAALRTEESPLL